MIDIHMHLVPGVDDGAMDLQMVISMLQKAKEEGIRGIFATPHSSAYDYDAEGTRNQFGKLKVQTNRFFPGCPIYEGCEVLCDRYYMDQVLERLAKGCYPSMNGTRYVLIEFSQRVRPEDTMPCVAALIENGWVPVIAHMERYEYLRGREELVDQFRKAGCMIQVNAYSLVEEEEAAIRTWARTLVMAHRVDFLGTDAHRSYHRAPSARTGIHWLYDNLDKSQADAISHGNAQRFLLGQ